MEAPRSLESFTLLLTASLARDLDAAGQLSGTTRKVIHDRLAELRSQFEEAGEFAAPALTILDNITPAGSD